VADLGAALLVFEVLRARRPLQLAARSAILVAVSPVLLIASGIHGDPAGVAVALLLAVYLLVDRDAPLVSGITLALASRVEPMVLLVVPVAVVAVASGAVAWDWDSLATAPSSDGGPGGRGPGWVLAGSLDQGLAGWLLGSGRPLVLAAAVLPAVVWVRRRPRRGLRRRRAPAAGAARPGPGLGLVTWVVLGSWAFLGWRTVAVGARAGGSGAGRSGAVDNRAPLATRSATLPRGGWPGPGRVRRARERLHGERLRGERLGPGRLGPGRLRPGRLGPGRLHPRRPRLRGR
jgi:hypothetical protein